MREKCLKDTKEFSLCINCPMRQAEEDEGMSPGRLWGRWASPHRSCVFVMSLTRLPWEVCVCWGDVSTGGRVHRCCRLSQRTSAPPNLSSDRLHAVSCSARDLLPSTSWLLLPLKEVRSLNPEAFPATFDLWGFYKSLGNKKTPPETVFM